MIEPIKSRDHLLPQRSDILFAPATIETMFWRPRFIVDTPQMQHAPFLFWLVAALRPLNVAVFGSGNGAAQFALCQAMDKLNLAGCCLGIGFWADQNTGKAGPVPATLRDHASQLYDDIVHWRIESSPREALAAIAPGSLDLLFIDACDLPEGELPRAEEWLRVLHRDGVIVVHGKLSVDDGRNLSGKLPVISFPDEQGLVVLTLSDAPPPRLRALQEASDQGTLPGEIGLFFRRLGQGHLAVARQAVTAEENRTLTSTLSDLRRERDEALTLGKEMREAYEARGRKLSELQEEFIERETRLAGFEQQIEANRQEASVLAAKLKIEREARSVEVVALAAQMETARQQHEQMLADAKADAGAQVQIIELKQELDKARQKSARAGADLERERKTRFSETAALTRHMESLRHTAQKAEAELQQESKRLKTENARLEKQVTDLLNSTSWRVTAPMRKFKSAFSRR